MRTIQHSVGDGGLNHPSDVRVIQQLLRENGIRVFVPERSLLLFSNDLPLPYPDGICDRSTILHIEAFQWQVLRIAVATPGFGIVEPGSATLYALNGLSGGQHQPTQQTTQQATQQPPQLPAQQAPHSSPHPVGNIRRVTHREWFKLQAGIGAARGMQRLQEGEVSAQFGEMVGRSLIGDQAYDPELTHLRRYANQPASYRITEIRLETTESHQLGFSAESKSIRSTVDYIWGPPQALVRIKTRSIVLPRQQGQNVPWQTTFEPYATAAQRYRFP